MAVVLASAAMAQSNGGGVADPPADTLGRALSSSFMENRGQWNSNVLYMSSQKGLNYWVTKDGMVLDLYRIRPEEGYQAPAPGEPLDFGKFRRLGHAVAVKFVGGNPNPGVESAGNVGSKIDFFNGDPSRHVRGVESFREAYVKDIYPGVHLRNYLTDGGLRYDMVVMPGANPTGIQMQIDGAQGVSLDSKGGLVISTSIGEIRNSAPVVYQLAGAKQIKVDAKFVVKGDTVSFELGKVNPKLPLIIDPLVYGTYLGSNAVPFFSSGLEQGLGAANDARGNLYVAGQTTSITFPVNNGPYNISLAGSNDAFLARISADAYNLDYAAYIGGTLADIGRGIGFAQSSGVLWIGGSSASADFPGRIAGNNRTNTIDYFVAQFAVNPTTSAITPVATRLLGQPGNFGTTAATAQWSDLLVDPTNSRVTIVGSSTTALLATGGATPLVPTSVGGTRDGFLLTVAPDFSVNRFVWFGSRVNDTVGRAGINASGSLVLAGTVQNAGLPNQDTGTAAAPTFVTTPGGYENSRLLRNNDAYIIRLNPDGSVAFSSLLGGSDNDTALAATIDAAGSVYVTGKPGAIEFPRTRGAFKEDMIGDSFLTKINSSGSTLVYSTALGHQETVIPSVVRVDARGVAIIGGTVGWRPNPAAAPTAPTIPGSIPVTPDAVDGQYLGGNENADAAGNPPDATTFPSSTDGFVQFVSATGATLLYSDYIGGGGNEQVADLSVDAFGGTWILGNTTPVANGNGALKQPLGVPPYITGDAFKDVPDSGNTDIFAIKLRVGLPILNSVAFNPISIAGGLGASTTATISLRAPAPVGGVTLTATLLNPLVGSFSSTGSQATTTINIPQGAQTTTVQVFSLPVSSPQTCDMRVTLDNDFKIARFTVNPWLDDFSVTPLSVVGGNQLTARVRLFQNAISNTTLTLTTDRPDLVTLPSPSQIVVPAGASSATILLNTVGVDADSSGVLTANLLGVSRNAPFTLTPARLASLVFNPGRVLSGEASNMTIQLDGRTGVARTINLTQGPGTAGITIDGRALPTTVTIPAQANSATFGAIAPIVPSSTSTNVIATDGALSVNGTLFVDDIDITGIGIAPATNVISGTVLTGTVTLSRPAGPNGFSVNLSSSNPAAGSLSTSTLVVAAGQTTGTFTFNCAVVPLPNPVTTTISASKPGFSTRSVNITVRPIGITLSLNPTSVTGGLGTSTASVTLTEAAPAGGLTVTFSSSNNAVASLSRITAVVPAGSTTLPVSERPIVNTNRVAVDTVVNITASAGPSVNDTKPLTVLAPSVLSLTLNPTTIFGSQSSTGTVRISTTAPTGGMSLNLSASPGGVVTLPATVVIPAGSDTGTFSISTGVVLSDTNVTITVAGSSSSANAILSVLSPNVQSITFSPPQVRGGFNSVGTVRLSQPAPTGGLTIAITSDNPALARPTVATVTIAAGATTATFPVTTSRVVRRIAVGFNASAGSRTAKGYLHLTP